MTIKILTRKSFTLLELLVVVVIVGLVAAFAVPSYSKSFDRTKRKGAENNLRVIWAAQAAYAGANGVYYLSVVLSDVNTNLGLNILPNDGFDYACTGTATTYLCKASKRVDALVPGAPFHYELELTEAALSATNPTCVPSVGSCP